MSLFRRLITSISKTGSPKLRGDVTFSTGTNVSITQTGNDIQIGASNPSIGGGITGGTQNSILFVNPSATIAQDVTNLSWDDTTNQLKVAGGQATFQPVSTSGNTRIAEVHDEATTNLVTNPSCETNITGYSAVGTGTAIAQSNAFAWIGSNSLRVTTTALTGRGVQLASIAVSPNTTYIFSFYLKSTSAPVPDYNPATNRESLNINFNGNVSGLLGFGQYIIPYGDWTRGWAEWTSGPSDTSVILQVLTASAIAVTWYMDAFQLEQKSISSAYSAYGWPTTYCDGSLGAGHSWSGTAHASTSSRVAGKHVLAPTTSLSQNPWVRYTDGNVNATHQFQFSERMPYATYGGNQFNSIFGYDFVGNYITDSGNTYNGGLMRVWNKDSGIAMWVKSESFGNEPVMLIEGANCRAGSLISVAAPKDLSNFTGYYLRFFDKSNKDMFTVRRDTLNYGNKALGYDKEFRILGGGKANEGSSTLLTSTGGNSITFNTGTTSVTGVGSTFTTQLAVGDTIFRSGSTERYVVVAIASNTALTVHANIGVATGGTGAGYKLETNYGPTKIYFESPYGNHAVYGNADPTSCLYNTCGDLLRFNTPSYIPGSGTLTLTAGSPTVTLSTNTGNNGSISSGSWIHIDSSAGVQVPLQVALKSSLTMTVTPTPTISATISAGNWDIKLHDQFPAPTDNSDGYSLHHTLYTEATSAGPSGQTAEVSLFAAAPKIRASTMFTNRPIRVTMYGTCSGANAAKTLTLRVKLGPTTICQSIAEVLADTTTNHWNMTIIIAPNASESSQKTILDWKLRQQVSNGNSDSILVYANSTVNTAADQVLDVTAQYSAASTMTCFYKIVEVL